MSDEHTIAILNRLLEAEQAGLIPRLGEAEPHVTWPAATHGVLVDRLVGDAEAHRRDLAGAILELRGSPAPPHRSIDSGGVHYVQLTHLMPDVIADLRKLVAAYESATGSGDPDADALIARILDDHRRRLAEIETLQA